MEWKTKKVGDKDIWVPEKYLKNTPKKKRRWRSLAFLMFLIGLCLYGGLGIAILDYDLLYKYRKQGKIILKPKGQSEPENEHYDRFHCSLLTRIKEVNPNTARIKMDLQLTCYNLPEPELFKKYGYIILAIRPIKIENGDLLAGYETESLQLVLFEELRSNRRTYKFEKKDIEVETSLYISGYSYPFDKYTIGLAYQILHPETIKPVIKEKLSSKETKSLEVFDNQIVVDDSRFLISSTFSTENNPPVSFFIELNRPYYQIATVIVITTFSIVLSILSMIKIFLAKPNDNKLEILVLNVTLIVGLPTFRQVIIPNNLNFSPLFDIPVTIVFIISLLTIFIYIWKEQNTQKSNESYSNKITKQNYILRIIRVSLVIFLSFSILSNDSFSRNDLEGKWVSKIKYNQCINDPFRRTFNDIKSIEFKNGRYHYIARDGYNLVNRYEYRDGKVKLTFPLGIERVLDVKIDNNKLILTNLEDTTFQCVLIKSK
ncbi:hypothetical protein [Thermoflavimicrobium dichotomicum]|uniref:Uncharacterized protein n=1 Tax=Thermoflavimicrobium dichotomicum TaxID=46223 RepID=A0A1I3TEY7_9BACL|nr:hypothetical protein [Thermoflavimicrobium dichotomicum]SFJ69744.1 hypothetical protein SAMN05421852_11756 [Thermoflavimicrobium dichotomicum]